MDFTEEQHRLIQQMADEGADLGAIQKRLADELGITVTYLETRMLVADLGIIFPEKEPGDTVDTQPSLIGAGPGDVRVSLSDVTPPGMIATGDVTFSDGEQAAWYLDQMGRLGLDPAKPDYHPSESDVVTFQEELKRLAELSGF